MAEDTGDVAVDAGDEDGFAVDERERGVRHWPGVRGLSKGGV